MASPIDRWLESSAHDGASAPIGVEARSHPPEVDMLMEAWSREHHDSTESQFLLARARRLLSRILAEGGVTVSSERRAKSLFGAIDVFSEGVQ